MIVVLGLIVLTLVAYDRGRPEPETAGGEPEAAGGAPAAV